jgi:hypothetical protein
MRNDANLNFAQFCNEVVRTAFKKSRDDITIIAVRSRLFKVDGEKQHEQQQKPRNTAKANPLPRLLNRLLRQRHQQ